MVFFNRFKPNIPKFDAIQNDVKPCVKKAIKKYNYSTDYKYILCEVSTISYMMGMGYKYNVAKQIYDSWHCHDNLPDYYHE